MYGRKEIIQKEKNKNGKIIRVSNEKAEKMVNNEDYEYCPKSEYKRQELD